MRLYEIDKELESLIDPDTGELLDYARFEELNMVRERKIEGMALWYKDLIAEAAMIQKEETALADRRREIVRRADRLKQYLGTILGQGEKFKTPRVAISWRKSEKVEVDDGFVIWAENSGNGALLTYKTPEPNKAEIRRFCKNGNGGDCPHARVVINYNMGVK